MVTREGMEALFSRISIPHGMWVAAWEADGGGSFITTGNSHSEALEAAKRMGATNPAIMQNVSGKACELHGFAY